MTENQVTFDLLLSFAFHAKLKTDIAALRKAVGPEALILIDSGAFTAYSTGQEIDLEDYAAYLREWEGVYDGAITLDVIGDEKATWKNTHTLWDMGLPVIPVHTFSAPVTELDKVLKVTDWFAIGGVAGGMRSRDQRRRFITALVQHAQRRGVACHVLGQSSSRMLRSCTPFSCDVSTPARSLLHGTVSFYSPSIGRCEQVLPKDVKRVRRYNKDLARHGMRASELLSGTIFNSKERRASVVRGADSGLAAMAYDSRKRVTAEVPKRLAGRMPGPRVCNALVTEECVKTMLTIVDNGLALDPILPILERRIA